MRKLLELIADFFSSAWIAWTVTTALTIYLLLWLFVGTPYCIQETLVEYHYLKVPTVQQL